MSYSQSSLKSYEPVATSTSSSAVMRDGVIVAEEHTSTTVMNAHEKMLHEQRTHQGMGLGWVGHLLLWAFIFFVFWWLIFFSVRPWFCLNKSGDIDTARVAGWAAVAALLTVVILWIIVWVVRRSKRC